MNNKTPMGKNHKNKREKFPHLTVQFLRPGGRYKVLKNNFS
jgi:hypothetical protein